MKTTVKEDIINGLVAYNIYVDDNEHECYTFLVKVKGVDEAYIKYDVMYKIPEVRKSAAKIIDLEKVIRPEFRMSAEAITNLTGSTIMDLEMTGWTCNDEEEDSDDENEYEETRGMFRMKRELEDLFEDTKVSTFLRGNYIRIRKHYKK